MKIKREKLPKDHPDAPPPWWRPDAQVMGWSLPRVGWGFLLLIWAMLIAWLLLASRSWSPDFLPAWLRPAGYVFGFLQIYGELIGPDSWNWWVGRETWRDIAIGAAGLGAMFVVGRFFLSCFETYLPRVAHGALAFVMGIGVCGVAFTFMAMAGLLYQWLAIALWFLLAGTLYFLARRIRRGREERLLSESADLSPDSLAKERNIRARCQLAQQWERQTWQRPTGWIEKSLAWTMIALFGILTALTFFHALFFPETYWDSLILYLGHSRQTFLEHGFPTKVVLQVGVGLGSNYPHLYELTGAVIAAWANRWSPIYLQLASPLAGLLTMALIYHTALRLSRSVLTALTVTLLLRAVPHLLIYNIYATNYSFAIFYSAAFFYLALRYIEDGLPSYFALATAAAAFAVHINYLMGSLWICWAVLIIVAHWPRRQPRGEGPGKYLGIIQTIHETPTPEYTQVREWPTLRRFLGSAIFWKIALFGLSAASIWYIRNWIVTGNPVYAFFTGIFTNTKHFNQEVLDSANLEWQAHGAGIGIYGPGLGHRLACSWSFFVNNYLQGRRTCWRWSPSIVGLALPGLALYLGILLRQIFIRRETPGPLGPLRARILDDTTRLGFVAFVFGAILFYYHYCMGPFYLYHLLPCFAIFGIFMTQALQNCPRLFLRVFALYAIFCAFMPGLPMALMGHKLNNVPGKPLVALHNGGLPEDQFNALKWGGTPRMWQKINKLCKDSALLTHENRHMVFDPSITLVHMDDWEVQQIWGKSSEERLEALWALGVRYYLQVPFERDHPINARLGHSEWIADGTLEKIYQVLDQDKNPHVLYRFPPPSPKK